MNNYRRIFTMGILVVVLLSVLTACTATAPNTSSPVHLTMWTIAVEADATHNAFANAVAAYNDAHQDVQIDISYIPDPSYKTQLEVAIGAGDTPDIFQTWGGGTLQSQVEAGVVREIEALSGETGDTFRSITLGPSTFEGKHYAVPVDLVFVYLWYNKDLFAQTGVELPTTWSEFLTACETFSNAGIIPVAVGNKERWPGGLFTDYLVNRIGGQEAYLHATYNQDNGGSFTDPTFVEAWTKIREAVEAGCFEEGVNASDSSDAGLLVATGKAAMQLQGNWMLFYYRDIDETYADSRLGMMPFPTIEGGAGNPADLMGGTGQAMAISSSAPPEAEEALIEMLGSEQFARDLANAGLIPAVDEYDDELFANDPMMMSILQLLSNAPSLHLLYGTDLPAQLADTYWNVTQKVFGLAATPEEAAAEMQAAAEQSTPNP
jgi:raffinose/stachyose/melibiose transport system substrate-binding protein